MTQIYLASKSLRRLQLLQQLGLDCDVLAVDVDETPLVDEASESYVQRLAVKKARQASERVTKKNQPIVAADTTVTCDGKILGKPKDQAHAFKMWQSLSANTHQVFTGVAVAMGGNIEQQVCCTAVTFRALSEDDMTRYWASGEPQDKAGGYGIQGKGALFVSHIEGSYSNVVGLPLFETGQLLSQAGIESI
ncbi:MAG: septum formation inhibitor Maf [Gammaproteobacteria bacterium]|nr:septum formation inhibitor Maf [Gammaproteobacteria bacterium]